jgi:hypothetical protein
MGQCIWLEQEGNLPAGVGLTPALRVACLAALFVNFGYGPRDSGQRIGTFTNDSAGQAHAASAFGR